MRFIVRFLAVIGLLVIVGFVLLIFAVAHLHLGERSPKTIAANTVLTFTVEGPLTEESPARTGLMNVFSGHARKLRDVIAAIDRAAKDGRIKGVVLKTDASAGMAQTQELRAAIKRFRDGGKFVYAFSDDYGETSSGNGEYYLAAACDQVWLQPAGETMITNVVFEAPFLKDALAKIDVDPEFVKRSEYKTAPETFTERGFTAAAREMMETLATDLTQQLIADIAAGRNMTVDEVHAAIDRGPMTAEDAVKAKLVDYIGYADEVVAAAKKAAGDNAATMSLADYFQQTIPAKHGAANIALIYEVGEIDRVKGPIDSDAAARGLDEENAVEQGFAKAIANPDIKAIVFRVDSPGGSVAGSESIRRMVVLAKQAGKKIVVSMGATAASGGYWIAADADKIIADPATLTGSIGVFSGKFVVGKGLADIGITIDRTAGGAFAGMDSPFTPFSPEQSQSLNKMVDNIYDGFVSRVAQGRNMPPATVAESAKGRVWSGRQAAQLGLIDTVGGLTDAVQIARDLGGIPHDRPTNLVVYPEPLSPFAALRALASGEGGVQGDIGVAIGEIDGPAGAVLRAVAPLFRHSRTDRVRMPDIGRAP
jgi:protease-4